MRNPVIVLAILLIGLTACSAPSDTGNRTPPPLPAPIINITAPATAETGEIVTFNANVNAHGRAYTVTWAFGDGAIATGNPVTRQYASAGTFAVTATATAGGQTATAAHAITISAPAAVTPDPDPEPEPDPEPASPFDGEAHLGTWTWVAITSATQYVGTVAFTDFRGDVNATTREAIYGEWTNCTYGTCATIGQAIMAELFLEDYGWRHSFAFFNDAGTIRALGAELTPYEFEAGPGYMATGTFYDVRAAFGLVHMDASALSTLSVTTELQELLASDAPPVEPYLTMQDLYLP